MVLLLYRYKLSSELDDHAPAGVGVNKAPDSTPKVSSCLRHISHHSFIQLTVCWHYLTQWVYSGDQNTYSPSPNGAYDFMTGRYMELSFPGLGREAEVAESCLDFNC